MRFVFAFTCALLIAACGSDPGFNEETDFINKEGGAQFVNMMSDSPEVTLLHGLNRTPVLFPFASSVESRFVDRYDWQLAYIGSNNEQVTLKDEEDQQILEDTVSVFLLMGSVDQPDVQIVDIPLPPLSERPETEAAIWFAANVANHSMLDVYVTDHGADLSAASPLATVNSPGFTDLFTIPAAQQQQIRVTIAGTTTLLFDSGSLEIPGQTTDLIAIVDDFGPDSANHVDVIRTLTVARSLIEDVSQSALLRFANQSTVDPLSASVGTTTFTAVSRDQQSAFQESDHGAQPVVISDGSTTTETGEISPLRGLFSTLWAFNDESADTQPATRSILVPDDIRQVKDRTLVTFINGSSDVVDLHLLRDGVDLGDVAPAFNDFNPGNTAKLEAPVGNTRFIATVSNGFDQVASVTTTLSEGESYTIVIDTEDVLRLLEN